MSVDIETIVLEKIRIGKHFSLQLDEYTDIRKNVQLLANMRFVDGDIIRKNSLFCKTLVKTTREEIYCIKLQRNILYNVGNVVEWVKHRTDDQHNLGLKPSCAIPLCPWERHFTALSPAWWSWQAVLNYSNISTKLLADSNILESPEAGRGNCLPYV